MPKRRWMPPAFLPVWHSVTFSLCLTAVGAAAPPTDNEKTTELETLRARIEGVQRELDTTQAKADSVYKQLRDTEVAIGKAAKRLEEIERSIKEKLVTLEDLERSRRTNQAKIISERDQLAQQIRAAYMMGQHDFLKLLLNQQDPSAMGRVLIYYEYHNRARTQRIALTKEKLSAISAIEESIKLEAQALQDLKAEQLESIDKIKAYRASRKRLIAQLHQELDRHGEELERLRKDERRLEALIESLGEVAPAPLEPLDDVEPFATLKGKLTWPVDGKLVTRFGSPKKAASLKWQGVFISARPGEELQAINHGRVVFADWFRTLGLLIIIDHGDGYMSVYGHNQSLYKSVGDWVEAGEVIASVGNTGGQTNSGLYFEIRHEGEPQNPALWCRSSRQAQ
jgi:septal ring factor EnvC (AmiA/AmiB activator)